MTAVKDDAAAFFGLVDATCYDDKAAWLVWYFAAITRGGTHRRSLSAGAARGLFIKVCG